MFPLPNTPGGTPVPVPPPDETRPDPTWEHLELYENVIKALYSLPSLFKTDLTIQGVIATDLFTFNTSLGATIETQVVAALNAIRETWDPEKKYTLYSFVRQSQRFPDVILRTNAPGQEPAILLGIELKGWYALSKEEVPSFRYKVTPAACAPADLLVVYPWALSNVISGSPLLFRPYVTSARYAAEYRNHWWQHIKEGDAARNVVRLSLSATYYPAKSDPISDTPVHDGGGNFGRFARTHLMDEYLKDIFRETLSGIPLAAWQKFLAAFAEEKTDSELMRDVERAIRETDKTRRDVPNGKTEIVQAVLQRLMELLAQE